MEKKTGLALIELVTALQGCEGLVVRMRRGSSDALIAMATVESGRPRGCGRRDNIDVAGATARGFVVDECS